MLSRKPAGRKIACITNMACLPEPAWSLNKRLRGCVRKDGLSVYLSKKLLQFCRANTQITTHPHPPQRLEGQTAQQLHSLIIQLNRCYYMHLACSIRQCLFSHLSVCLCRHVIYSVLQLFLFIRVASRSNISTSVQQIWVIQTHLSWFVL